jgi:hypothetical protein
MRERRREELIASMPAWLLPDPADRRMLAERAVGRGEPALAEHPNVSIVFEEAFATRRRTGVAMPMPLLDAAVVEFLAGLDPAVLLHRGQAKALALDAIERRLPAARPWPRTIFGGDVWAQAMRCGGAPAAARLRRVAGVGGGALVTPEAADALETGSYLHNPPHAAGMYDLVAIANWLDVRIIAP